MDNLKENINALLTELDGTTELFYQQKLQEAYQNLQGVIGQMMETVDKVYLYKQEQPDFPLDEEGLMGALKETVSVMEEQDAVLVADVLKYEVMEKFQEIADNL